jgi:hypothetical protein
MHEQGRSLYLLLSFLIFLQEFVVPLIEVVKFAPRNLILIEAIVNGIFYIYSSQFVCYWCIEKLMIFVS